MYDWGKYDHFKFIYANMYQDNSDLKERMCILSFYKYEGIQHIFGVICSMVFRNNELISWSKVSLEKPIVAQLVKKSLPSMEPEDSLSCSQEVVTGLSPEPDESSSDPFTLIFFVVLDHRNLKLNL
jgi:hypothetical protein